MIDWDSVRRYESPMRDEPHRATGAERAPVSVVMSTGEIYTVRHDETLSEACRLFDDHGIEHLPVLENERLIGVLSTRDLMRLRKQDEGRRVAEFMQRALVTVNAKQPVHAAARLLAEGSFHALPVVDAEGELVGIVTSSDVIRFYLARDEGGGTLDEDEATRADGDPAGSGGRPT